MSVSAACPSAEDHLVRVEGDLDAAVALMTVRGPWEEPLQRATTTALNRCLAGRPEALILDLSGLDDPACRSATTWTAAQRKAASLDPVVQLALCIPPRLPLADRMQRLAVRGHLPVYAKPRQAQVAITSRFAAVERLSLPLRPEPESPSIARNLAGEACTAWELPKLLHPSRLVISELVTNAIEHARTAITVAVSRRGNGVHLTVSDGEPALPRLIRPARPRPDRPLDERGRGMRIVAATADAWGSLPTRTGKVVWATLTATAPR